ncbi:MAG TPA: nuclear transport factor 2 family protein [Gemmatimonadaceae bacterium]|nr:nuclear transport factor 2 family protein [Gemmatimonadaceae bacterium]
MTESAFPLDVIARLNAAMNRRDLKGFVACFDPAYISDQPAHPDRHFRGVEQVERNWSMMFGSLPDFHADILSQTEEGSVAWVEWQWSGTRADKSKLNARGVCLFGVDNGLIKWGRLYMEDVSVGDGVEAAVDSLAKG